MLHFNHILGVTHLLERTPCLGDMDSFWKEGMMNSIETWPKMLRNRNGTNG